MSALNGTESPQRIADAVSLARIATLRGRLGAIGAMKRLFKSEGCRSMTSRP